MSGRGGFLSQRLPRGGHGAWRPRCTRPRPVTWSDTSRPYKSAESLASVLPRWRKHGRGPRARPRELRAAGLRGSSPPRQSQAQRQESPSASCLFSQVRLGLTAGSPSNKGSSSSIVTAPPEAERPGVRQCFVLFLALGWHQPELAQGLPDSCLINPSSNRILDMKSTFRSPF